MLICVVSDSTKAVTGEGRTDSSEPPDWCVLPILLSFRAEVCNLYEGVSVEVPGKKNLCKKFTLVFCCHSKVWLPLTH